MCSERDETTRLTNDSNIYWMYLNLITFSAARDLHSAACTLPDFQESVLQNTSFPFGVFASGHRFSCPGGTSFRDTAPGELRETVSRNASFAGETSVLGFDERRTRQFDSLQVRVALITFTLKKVKVEIQRKHAHLPNSYSL